MKVFISWSGDHSRQFANAIREWLPRVLQAAKPYFTPADIEKGAKWDNEISKELEQSDICIITLTRESLNSQWIMFEAGAISRRIERARVCPIVFNIEKTDIQGPLSRFQATAFNEDEIRQLLTTINKAANEAALTERDLDAVFEKWWPDLEREVATIFANAQQPHPGRQIRTEKELLEENLATTRALLEQQQVLSQRLWHLIELQSGRLLTTLVKPGGLPSLLDLARSSEAPDQFRGLGQVSGPLSTPPPSGNSDESM
jgi:hypothetical protein